MAGIVRRCLDIPKPGNPRDSEQDVRPAVDADQRVVKLHVVQANVRQCQVATGRQRHLSAKLKCMLPRDGAGEEHVNAAVLFLGPMGDTVCAIGQDRQRVHMKRRRCFQAILKYAASRGCQLRVEPQLNASSVETPCRDLIAGNLGRPGPCGQTPLRCRAIKASCQLRGSVARPND